MFRLSFMQSIEVTLAASITSNQLQGTASYLDLISQTDSNLLSQRGETFPFLTNHLTDVTAVPSPLVNGTVRNMDLLNLYNADSATAQVTVKMNNNGTDYLLVRQDLDPRQTLFFTRDGWGII